MKLLVLSWLDDKKQKVPHKNAIDFAISLFFSLLRQEYNNNTMNILKR